MKMNKSNIAHNANELASILGLSPVDALEIERRRNLNTKVIDAVHKSGLTHAQIAELAKTSRTRITAIVNRNTHGVSTDLMFRILASLGYKSKISFLKIA